MNNQTLQTQAAFDRIKDSLMGKTTDDLDEIIETLEQLLNKAKKIKNICKSSDFGIDLLTIEDNYAHCRIQ